MTSRLTVILSLILAFSLHAAVNTEIVARVISVHDGDTITVLTPEKVQLKIRLEGIDVPELGQPFGTKAKKKLTVLILGKDVLIEEHGTDRYKRIIGRIMVGGFDINLELVKRGLAWCYQKYSKEPALLAAQAEAQSAPRGLWIAKNPIPPWEWRKMKRSHSKHLIKSAFYLQHLMPQNLICNNLAAAFL